MSKPTLAVTKDITKEVNALLKQFKKDGVLVGIPATDEARESGDEINNAALLAINNFGSPANNIPARPVMQLGIKAAQEDIIEQFRKIVSRPTAGFGDWKMYLERVGIIASNSVKRVINTNEGIEPPADSTLKARKYITQSGFKGKKSLVVTGQMRNAITYVVNAGGDVITTNALMKETRWGK